MTFMSFFLATIVGMSPCGLNLVSQQVSAQTSSQVTKQEADRLAILGKQQSQKSQYQEALATFTQELNIRRKINDQKGEAIALKEIGTVYLNLNEYPKALENYEKSVAISRKVSDRDTETRSLNNIGLVYYRQTKYDQALNSYQKSLAITTEIGNKVVQVIALNNTADVYKNLKKYAEAIAQYNKVVVLRRELKDRSNEAWAINSIGNVLLDQTKYDQAFEKFKESLAIHMTLNDNQAQGVVLFNIGLTYENRSRHKEALQEYTKALEFSTKENDLDNQSRILNRIAAISRLSNQKDKEAVRLRKEGISLFYDLDNFKQALVLFNKAVDLSRANGDKQEESINLYHIGRIYFEKGQNDASLNSFKAALKIAQDGNRLGEVSLILDYISAVYESEKDISNERLSEKYRYSLLAMQHGYSSRKESLKQFFDGNQLHAKGEFQQALQTYEEGLSISRKNKDTLLEVQFLQAISNLGTFNTTKTLPNSQNVKLLELREKALQIAQESGWNRDIYIYLADVAEAYFRIGKFEKARSYYGDSYDTFLVDIKRKPSFPEVQRGIFLANLNLNVGVLLKTMGLYEKAIDVYKEVLTFTQGAFIANRKDDARINLASIYLDLEQPDNALQIISQVDFNYLEELPKIAYLTIFANIRTQKKEYSQAIKLLEDALAIAKESKFYSLRQVGIYTSLGLVYLELKEYEKSLDYYANSLRLVEDTVYSNNNEFGKNIDYASVLRKIGFAYESIEKNELAISFYKQSISFYEKVRRNAEGIPSNFERGLTESIAPYYRRLADLLLQQNRSMEALMVLDLLKQQEYQEFFKLPKQSESEKIPLLPEEIDILESSYRNLILAINNPKVKSLSQQIQQTAPQAQTSLTAYQEINKKLIQIEKNAALIYPVILNDRVEVILFLPNSIPIHRAAKVSKAEVEKTIQEFRQTVSASYKDPIPSAQKLYSWFIQPIESDLEKANIASILYAPDGQLRYVPLAALHDGKQWLAEKYAVNYLTSLALTPITRTQINSQSQLVAAGLSTGRYNIKIAGENINLPGLNRAEQEVQNVSKLFNNSQILVNKNFTKSNLIKSLQENEIALVASHAQLYPDSNKLYSSFLLTGDNNYITLKEIEDEEKFPISKKLKLIILSACQTAIGGKLGTGIEVLGMGYQLQRRGVPATISTLWNIDDSGSRLLVEVFHQEIIKGNSPVKALQRTQKAAIYTKTSATQLANQNLVTLSVNQLGGRGSDKINHPYYWASFILVGNGF